MLTQEQVKERLGYIGGSDAAAVLGLSRWKTPLEVWAEKTGKVEPEDISDKYQVRFGVKMEAVLAEMWQEDTGKVLHRKNETVVHPKYPFLAANIDRRVVGEKAGWEAKYFSPHRSDEFENDEMPYDCILQCYHYLAVTGWDRWYFIAALGNKEPVRRIIERDEKTIKEIVSKEVAFWKNFIEPKIMPNMIKAADNDVLYKLFPRQTDEKVVQLNDDAMRLVESVQSLTQDMLAIERQIEQHKNQLKAVMQDAELAVFNEKKIATWREVKSVFLDTKTMKEKQPDIFEKYQAERKTRVFRLR